MSSGPSLSHVSHGGIRGLLGTRLRAIRSDIRQQVPLRVVLTLAAVLGLQSADGAAVGSDATALETGLGINVTQIGLLLSVGIIVGAVMSLPAGVLVDRADRTRLLTWAVAGWGVAMAASAAARGYDWLLLSRIGLGGLAAVAGPAVASLMGDYVPAKHRARIYSYVLCGELIGAGFGLVVAGELAALNWRVPLVALTLPTALVCWLAHRLPEPERGAQTDGKQQHFTLWQAVRYVLRVRTNVVLIVVSALGYLFFAGVRGFAVQFAEQQYSLSQPIAVLVGLAIGIAAVVGLVVGGRLADRLLRQGHTTARVVVPGCAVFVATAAFLPGVFAKQLWLAMPLLLLGGAALGASTAPLDAARLDIVQSTAWGRAEAVRTLLRDAAEGGSPLLFGFLAGGVFAGHQGLRDAFALTLVALVAEGLVLITVARRTYARDRNAASVSNTRTRR